jgi:MutS domain I
MVVSERLIARYAELKTEAPGCLLLMQVGSFMQVMGDDARAISAVTGLKLQMGGSVDAPVVLPADGRVRTMRTRRRGERGRVRHLHSNKILPPRAPLDRLWMRIAGCEGACHPPGAKRNPVPSPRGRCGVDLPEWKSAGRGEAGVRGSQGTISRGGRS